MYQVTFIDNTFFRGGRANHSRWNEMPNKPIKEISYFLNQKKITLQNYEAYNHLVEKIWSPRIGKKITKVILMARNGENVVRYIFDFVFGSFDMDSQLFGKEYNNKPTTGWKQGIEGQKPKTIVK